MEGLIHGGKFAFHNLALQLKVNLPFLLCFTLYLIEGNFQVQAPGGGGKGLLTEGFLRYEFEGLIHGRAYFRNFTVHCLIICP